MLEYFIETLISDGCKKKLQTAIGKNFWECLVIMAAKNPLGLMAITNRKWWQLIYYLLCSANAAWEIFLDIAFNDIISEFSFASLSFLTKIAPAHNNVINNVEAGIFRCFSAMLFIQTQMNRRLK